MSALTPGTRLGSYEIVSLLGSGGMGEVYKAKDLKLGRDVAIKVLREDLASDPERLRRFEQEARAASSLNHPNIVTIHDIGEHEGTRYIAMEYVEGKTLREMFGESHYQSRSFSSSRHKLQMDLPRRIPPGSCIGTSSPRTSNSPRTTR